MKQNLYRYWVLVLFAVMLPSLAFAQGGHKLTVTAKPAMAGTFNTNEATLVAGETIHLYAYANANFTFIRWTDDKGKEVSQQMDFTYVMPTRDVTLTAEYEYNPANPANPARNYWNKELGEVIVDDFTTGSLQNVVKNVIGDSKATDVMMITVAGVMNANDFGVINTYSACTLLDLSRVTGITAVPSYAFDYTKLESVYLPATIEKIGQRAFYSCQQLSSLIVYAMTPPALESDVFTGVPEGLVVYVPAAAIAQYQEANGWKDFTILPIQEDIRSITVSLPDGANANDYAKMWLELTNTKSGQRMHYVMTGKTQYTFANIIRNTSWNVVVRNERGDVFGQIDDVEVKDEDVSVKFSSMSKPQSVSLSVLTPEGKDVTEQVQITWTDAEGNYVAQGAALSGLPEGYQVNYRVVLSQELAMAYDTPEAASYTLKNGGNSLTCRLQTIKQIQLSGKVKDLATGLALSGAVVSASQTFGGKYSKTINTKTNNKGEYQLTIAAVPTSLAIAAADYISQTVDVDAATLGSVAHYVVPDVLLKGITGATITIGFTYTTVEGETQSWYSDYQNVGYTLHNVTKNRDISQYNVQYPQIVLLEEVDDGDVIRLTATSRTTNVVAFMPVTMTTVIAEQKAEASFAITELGRIHAEYTQSGNVNVVASLYDADGKLLKTYDYSNGLLTISNLADGQYTLVSMSSSQFFNSIYDLSQLPQTGLVKDTDYVQHTVTVKSGQVTNINIDLVPKLDESKFYYTGSGTSFTVNKPSIVAGNYLTLTGRIDFKPAYVARVSNVQMVVDLPESCQFVENSVMVGNSTSTYTLNGHQITIPMTRYTDRVRFCVIPTLGGEYAPSAFVQFDLNGKTVTQPIGSANYTAKDLSISVPSTVAKTTIPVSGTAVGQSQVEIYDNGVLIGQTTSLANGNWATTCELNEPYNLSTHSIYAHVTTKAGLELQSETMNCLYDINAIEVKTVTMINTAHTAANLELHDYVTVFDFQNPKESYPPYWYWPSYPDFTFLVDFTNNDTTIVKDVVLYVYTDDNKVIPLYPKYDEKKDKYVVVEKFYSNSLPYNVSVDFNAMVQQTIDGKQLLDAKNDIENYSKDFYSLKEVIDKFYAENEEVSSEDYFKLCEQLELYIDEEEMLPIDTSLSEGMTEEEIEEFLEKKQEEFDERFATITEEVAKYSAMFQLSDNYELTLDNGYRFVFESLDGMTEESMTANGYTHLQLTEGGSVYLLTEDDMMSFVNLSENIVIKIYLPASASNIRTKIRRTSLTDDFKEVFLDIEMAKTLVQTINEDFQKRIMMPIKAQEKYIHDLERDIQEIKRYITCMCKEGSKSQKFWMKRLKDAEHTLSVAKTALKLSGPLLRWLARSIPILSYMSTLADCYSIASELQSIYLSIPDPCPEDQANANWCKTQARTIAVATGMFAIAEVVAEITADCEILGGAAAAITTGGASLAVSGWGIVQKAIAEMGKYALTTATKHFAIKELRKRVRELKCKGPDPKPDPTPTPGGGAPNVKDPSGYVYEGVFSNRVEGVTATAYYKEMVEDMYGDLHENIVKWDATEYAQENPLFTDENGFYAWDVPNGLWQVKFEKEGYETAYSEWLPVPPPQLNVNIAMKQNVQPEVKAARAYEDAVEVEFDKYMMTELLTAENISVMVGGKIVEGTVQLLNEESAENTENTEDTENFASKIRFNAKQPFAEQEISLIVNNRVKSYAGIRMQDDYQQTFTVEQEVRGFVCDSVTNVGYRSGAAIVVQAVPAAAATGRTLTVSSSSPMILTVESERLTLDNEGKAVVYVNGELPGMAALTFGIEGCDIKGTTLVNVNTYKLGDLNHDNVIDVADIASIISLMAGCDCLPVYEADVNGDGVIDVADIATVISIMAGSR